MERPAPSLFGVRLLDSSSPLGGRAFGVRGQARIAETRLREGDILCVHPNPQATGLCVLEPCTPGYPLLGRRQGQRMSAEPSGLACSSWRWSPVGAVLAIWHPGRATGGERFARGQEGTEAPPATRRTLALRLPQAAMALARRAARMVAPPRSVSGANAQEPLAFATWCIEHLPASPEAILAEMSDLQALRADANEILLVCQIRAGHDAIACLQQRILSMVGLSFAMAVADERPDAIQACGQLEALGWLEFLPGRSLQAPSLPRVSVAAPTAWWNEPTSRVSRIGQAVPGCLERPSVRQLSLFAEDQAA